MVNQFRPPLQLAIPTEREIPICIVIICANIVPRALLVVYRLGGNSCLSGDFMGYWRFKQPLQIGDTIVFEDMIHYTTVKTNMFNGIHHPSLALLHTDGQIEVLRNYQYEDYRDRMD